ncbi:MAG TPA: hydrogenase maturation protease [Polyangiaceae bacterium]|nr:hydrogenase maturation protease [Polyangiaceae bacterium]
MTARRILVAGVGNVFHGDDAFGSVVARTLARTALPPGVVVMDAGIRGLDLLYALLEGWDAVVLVDAMARRGTPGALYVLDPELGPAREEAALDAHGLDPVAVLTQARAAGARLGTVRVVGCEPAVLEAEGLELSPAVEAAIGPACATIRDVLSELSLRPAVPAEKDVSHA